MEWYEQEGEDALLLVAGRQVIRGCIYLPQVATRSMVTEATILLSGLEDGTEIVMAREEGDRRYVQHTNSPYWSLCEEKPLWGVPINFLLYGTHF